MSIKSQYCLLILFFCATLMSSQNITIDKYNSIVNSETLSIEQKIKSVNNLLLESDLLKDDKNRAFICYDFGKKIRKNELEKAIYYTEKAYQILQKGAESDSEILEKSLNNLIRFYYRDQDYYKALDYSDKLISVLDKSSTRLARTYIIRGHIYRNLGDYSRSFDNHVKSELIFNELNNKKELSGVYINFLDLYCTLANSLYRKEFFEYYNKHLKLSEEHEIPVKNQIKVLINLGHFYDTLEEYENAIKVLDEALVLCKKYNADNYTINILTDIGVTQKKLGLIKEAKISFQQAVNLAKQYPKFLDDCYNNLAEIYLLENNHKKAIEYFDKSVKLLIPGFNDSKDTYLNNPTVLQLQNVTEKIDLLQYFADKARALNLFGDAEKNKKYYNLALEALDLSDYLIDKVYYESNEEFSKLFWRKRGFNIYNNAIVICHKLNNPEKAFYFMEKSKALLLLDNISELKAKLKANIPSKIRDREVQLQENISQINKDLQSEQTNSILIDSLQNSLFLAKEQYSKFVDSLEISFPKYYQYKKAAKTLNVKQVQQNLNKNELVLSYNINTEMAYMSLVSKDVCQLFKLDSDRLVDKIMNYERLIKKPFVTVEDKMKFKELSVSLFSSLFPFADKLDAIKNKKLIIVKDQALKGVSFESLVIDKSLPLSQAYLLQVSDIRYVYSLSSLYKSLGDKSFYNQEFLMVNVDQFQNSTLIPLEQNQSNLGYHSNFKNSKISGHLATKDHFLKSYGDYKMVHLSTHGGVSENKPWVAFYDKKLFLDEMYFKNQKAELVTLSACKTSYGEYKTGEGVMSIARGFINAGSKSVYASLWDIDNKADQEIMTLVYKYLKKGDKKDEALSKAKREYLKLKENTSEAAPFYWSALVLIGDDAEIFSPFKKLPIIFLIVVILICFMYYLNKNSGSLPWRKNVNLDKI